MLSTSSTLSLLILTAFLGFVQPYSNGPPVDEKPEICLHMFPTGHNTTSRTDAPPYRLIFNTDGCYSTTDQPVHVTVHHVEVGGFYEGLFVQARLSVGTGPTSYGTFSAPTEPQLSPLSCGASINNTIGHNSHAHFTNQRFLWVPPAGFTQNIQFVATMVRGTTRFWLDVRSNVLRYNATCRQFPVTLPPLQPTTFSPPFTTPPSCHVSASSPLTLSTSLLANLPLILTAYFIFNK